MGVVGDFWGSSKKGWGWLSEVYGTQRRRMEWGEVVGGLWGSCGRVLRRSQNVRDAERPCRSYARRFEVLAKSPGICANVTPNRRGCRNITQSFCSIKTR